MRSVSTSPYLLRASDGLAVAEGRWTENSDNLHKGYPGGPRDHPMRAYLANLAAKSSQEGAVGAFGRWLLARQTVIRYGLAPAAVVLALLLRGLFASVAQDQPPYLFFVPAILAAAGIGGFAPG